MWAQRNAAHLSATLSHPGLTFDSITEPIDRIEPTDLLTIAAQGLSVIDYLDRYALVHTGITPAAWTWQEGKLQLGQLGYIYYQPGLNFYPDIMPLNVPAAYWPPEITDLALYDTRLMTWLFGCCLYQWVTGLPMSDPGYMVAQMPDLVSQHLLKHMLAVDVYDRPSAGKLLQLSLFAGLEPEVGLQPAWTYPYPLPVKLSGKTRADLLTLVVARYGRAVDKGLVIVTLQLVDIIASVEPTALSTTDLVHLANQAVYVATGLGPVDVPDVAWHSFTLGLAHPYLWHVEDAYLRAWVKPTWPSLDFSQADALISDNTQDYDLA